MKRKKWSFKFPGEVYANDVTFREPVSREYARANEAAQAMIAEIRAESFNQIVSRYENATFNVDFYPEQRKASLRDWNGDF